MEPELLFSLDQVTARYGEKVIFNGLSFEVRKGQHWVLLGPSGSGKSALLDVIAGNCNIVGGNILRPFYNRYVKSHPSFGGIGFRQLISYLPAKYQFRNLSNTTEFFYQQRFNAAFSEDAPTVEEYLAEIEASARGERVWPVQKVVELFQLGALLPKQLIKLSNGETKRLRLAAALLQNPVIFLLDNPTIGLDVDTRSRFDSILQQIVSEGTTIVMATTLAEIPAVATHAALLDRCQIVRVFERQHFNQIRVLEEVTVIGAEELQNLLPTGAEKGFKLIARLQNVTVRYGLHPILDNISWEIAPVERWALQGPNGAGKSTLLSLINGDNPQAYANDIVLFDRKRGSGESIWDIKKNIGFVSPELLQYFHTGSTCRDVLASGFRDTMGVAGQLSEQEKLLVEKWLRILQVEADAASKFETVPPAVQRLILIGRAMIKNPTLLILDEPCQGLDAAQQKRIRLLIDTICAASGVTLIYITHYEEELPECVDKVLKLKDGRRMM